MFLIISAYICTHSYIACIFDNCLLFSIFIKERVGNWSSKFLQCQLHVDFLIGWKKDGSRRIDKMIWIWHSDDQTPKNWPSWGKINALVFKILSYFLLNSIVIYKAFYPNLYLFIKTIGHLHISKEQLTLEQNSNDSPTMEFCLHDWTSWNWPKVKNFLSAVSCQ